MTAKDKKSGIDVGEEAIQRLAGQVFGAPRDHTKAEKSVEGKVNDEKKKKQQQQQQQQGQNDVEKKDKEKNRRITYAQKYHDVDLLAEAIIIGRKPCFAVTTSKVGNPDEISVTLQDSIPIDDYTVLKPFDISAYVNKPYSFKSEQEFVKFVRKTKEENLNSLYKKVKSIWKKYVDADDFHISICAADTIFTYFQDKIGLTHYLFFVGDNSSGKTNNITVLHFLGYRNMLSSDVTSANIYQFLGSGEEGVGTICEDEADNIDEHHDKMRIYKNGYTTGIPVFRTDTSFGRNQLRYNTFCFKAFAAERLPDSVKAKGFRQRIIELPCVYGFPKYDISEVMNPAGEEEYQQLLDELMQTRNTLLIYRLLHFKDKITDIKLNIQNREKQLFKPVLRVFQSTQALEELRPVISKYINQRRESNANSLHAFMYTTVKELIEAQNTYELESSIIWNTIKNTLQGSDIPHKPQSYDSTEFGVLSHKDIVQTLIEVFGAERLKGRTSRKLLFDPSKLERLSKIYDMSVDVQLVTHVAHVTHVGLDKHLQEHSDDKEFTASEHENTNISNEKVENNEKITSQEDEKGRQPCADVPQASHVSHTQTEQNNADQVDRLYQHTSESSNNAVKEYGTKLLLNQGAYWSSSRWNCKSCKYSYDGPGMIEHLRINHNQQQRGEVLQRDDLASKTEKRN